MTNEGQSGAAETAGSQLSEKEVMEVFDDTEREFREIRMAYADNKIELYFRKIDANYQFATMTGVIAGFGFTAIEYISRLGIAHILLFLSGEILLTLAIVLAVGRARSVYSQEYQNIEGAQARNAGLEGEVGSYLQQLGHGEISRKMFRSLKHQANNRTFSNPIPRTQNTLHPKSVPWLFVVGLLLILVSLIPVSALFSWVTQESCRAVLAL